MFWSSSSSNNYSPIPESAEPEVVSWTSVDPFLPKKGIVPSAKKSRSGVVFAMEERNKTWSSVFAMLIMTICISGVCYVSLVHLGYITDHTGVLIGGAGGAPLPLPGGPLKDPLASDTTSSSSSSSSQASLDSLHQEYAPVKHDPLAPPPTYRPSTALAKHLSMAPTLGKAPVSKLIALEGAIGSIPPPPGGSSSSSSNNNNFPPPPAAPSSSSPPVTEEEEQEEEGDEEEEGEEGERIEGLEEEVSSSSSGDGEAATTATVDNSGDSSPSDSSIAAAVVGVPSKKPSANVGTGSGGTKAPSAVVTGGGSSGIAGTKAPKAAGPAGPDPTEQGPDPPPGPGPDAAPPPPI